MATRRTTKRKGPASHARKKSRRAGRSLRLIKGLLSLFGLIPEDVVGLLLLAVALFAAVAFLTDSAGILGSALKRSFSYVFGLSRYVLVLYFASVGFLLLKRLKKAAVAIFSAGAAIYLVGLDTILAGVSGRVRLSLPATKFAVSGGFLGAAFYKAASYLGGAPGAYIFAAVFVLAGVILVSGASVPELLSLLPRGKRRRRYSPSPTQGQTPLLTTEPEEKEGEKEKEKQGEPQVEERTTQALEKKSPKDKPLQLSLPLNQQISSKWVLPPVSLLKRSPKQRMDEGAVASRGRALVEALASHGVPTRLIGATVGPTVTRYELELAPGVKVAKVTALTKDIAYALAAPDVRVLAPVPGKSAIGVEVPNAVRQLVSLGDVLTEAKPEDLARPLSVPLGKDVSGKVVFVSLAEMPHLLIAGATGSGKSSWINVMLISLLLKDTPEQLRLILVDPKRVELGHYAGLPHLLTDVVVDPKKAAAALKWAVAEMERRYELFASIGARNITLFNESAEEAGMEKVPYVVVVVDELNDLMMVASREVEDAICRLAQMARAVGIHLVVSTQRPSVDVITGVIKANIPARMAFSVSSLADSRVILDQAGAERLVGKGDMLFLNASSSTPSRIQAPYVSQDEVVSVVAHWKRQGAFEAPVKLAEAAESPSPASREEDELLEQAMELVVSTQMGSTSMLQRRLKIGFARAGRLMDMLEQRGVVGPAEGAKPRAVLMTPEELEQRKRAAQNAPSS